MAWKEVMLRVLPVLDIDANLVYNRVDWRKMIHVADLN